MDETKEPHDWRESKIVKGFWKSWAWLAAVGGFVVTVVPELASYLFLHTGVINTAFPKMTPETKELILTVAVGLVIVLRPFRQKNMPPVTIPVATVNVPSTVSVGHGGPKVATEVEHIDRSKVDPGPQG